MARSRNKTVKELFDTMQEPERSRAIANSIYLSIKMKSLKRAIRGTFIWDKTPEGNDYWLGIYNKYDDKLIRNNAANEMLANKGLKPISGIEVFDEEILKK